MTDPTRAAVLTTLLAGDECARKLMVSWPLVDGPADDARTLADWARAAGVPRSVAARTAAVLVRHGICLPDHTLDLDALRLASHFAAEALRGRRGSRR